MARVVLIALALLTACSTSVSLSEELVAPTSERITELSAKAGITLEPGDADCAARKLDDEVALQLESEPPGDEAVLAASESVVECVGHELIATAALTPQAGGVKASSLACAASRLDEGFVAALVANGMTGSELPDVEVELSVVTAFAVCLDITELSERQ